MSKKNGPTKEEAQQAINDVFKGADGLKKAKDMLEGLQDKLSAFQGDFLKNDAVKKAKAKHKGVLAGTLLEVLKEFEDANLSSEAARVKIAERFVDKYDKEVMSAVGM